MSLPFYEAISSPNDLNHTGGNNLTDGIGTVFSGHGFDETDTDSGRDTLCIGHDIMTGYLAPFSGAQCGRQTSVTSALTEYSLPTVQKISLPVVLSLSPNSLK